MGGYIPSKEYMKKYKLNNKDFSSYINSYILDHKYQNGRLYVQDNPPPTDSDNLSLEDMIVEKDLKDVPPPPIPLYGSQASDQKALSTDVITMSQISLFKEENKEILKFSEKSLNTMASYTQTIFKDKERIIELKEKQISELEKLLKDKDDIIRLLKQQTEDYHMLTSVLTDKK